METGALAMIDALGIKRAWEKHGPDAVLEKLATIEAHFNAFVNGQLGGSGHPNTANPSNGIKRVPVGFVSDTVVVPFIMKGARDPYFAVMMAARWAAQVTRFALRSEPAWAYRGAIAYGDFSINDRGKFFVGPAVKEAAENCERSVAAVIWLAPSAKTALSGAHRSDFWQGPLTIGEHDIPLKADGKTPATPYRTYAASPFDYPDPPSEAERIVAALLATFDLDEPGVPEKYSHTEALLRRHLDEYRTMLEEQAALIARHS